MAQFEQHASLHLNADDPDAPERIEGAVDAVLVRGVMPPRLTIALGGERLPDDTIAALITGLRRLREQGGAIAVAPASDPVRDAFALLGLGNVFAFPLVPPEAPRRSHLLGRLAAASFAAVLAFLGLPAYAGVDHPTDPSTIIAKVVQRNPSLSSYEGRMHVDLRMTSFPFLREHLEGTTYYKRPSSYEVVLDRVPPLAKGFDHMFTDAGDPSTWEKRFVITYVGEREFDGRQDIELRLVQRVRGMIDHETALVDPNTWVVDSLRYDYYNGGHITMTQTFREVGGYWMLAEQHADIAIPYARAVAFGSYTDYKTNVAIDDTVFTKKK
ncbi:MAG TPA: hypothetical protein VHT05_15115 [Candidatus Elarobacter sp.]|jgi:hypothetical protein|nr:hypothetical protein [Candidatus Elarobacter sp.]